MWWQRYDIDSGGAVGVIMLYCCPSRLFLWEGIVMKVNEEAMSAVASAL